MSFKDLKKASKGKFAALTQEVEKMSSGKKQGNVDERQWKLTVDKAGNGSAVIRFLPAPNGEDIPWVRIWDHGFKGPGGWYIENSLTTLDKQDPCSEHNSKLWNSGVESDKNIARDQKRRLSYYANIFVVKDPKNPENEGKVFLYKFGKKIFDKVNDLMNPVTDDIEDTVAINPFDIWEGANFKLRGRMVEGYRNYDACEFAAPSPLSDDEAEMESIWNQEYSLQEFLDPKHFKSYEELSTRLARVLGSGADATNESSDESPAPQRAAQSERPLPTAEADSEVVETGDGLDYFEALASEA